MIQTCALLRLTLKEQKIFTFEEMHPQKACAVTSKDAYQWLGSTSSNPSSTNWNFFTPMLSVTYVYSGKLWISNSFNDLINYNHKPSTMEALGYWSLAHEYSIWNTAVTALQFWMEDLKPCIFSNTIDWIYTASFYTDFSPTNMKSTRRNNLWLLCHQLR